MRNPYCPPHTDGNLDQKNKVSCAATDVKAEPGQVYEFTKDCVFFDDISGDYKDHTIKEGTTLTVGDDLCTKEGFSISAKHPVHLSYSWILNAIVKGDIRLKSVRSYTCDDSRIK